MLVKNLDHVELRYESYDIRLTSKKWSRRYVSRRSTHINLIKLCVTDSLRVPPYYPQYNFVDKRRASHLLILLHTSCRSIICCYLSWRRSGLGNFELLSTCRTTHRTHKCMHGCQTTCINVVRSSSCPDVIAIME